MSKKYTTNFLEDTNGSTGTTNQVLVSTATGVDWVDGSGSGVIGGPYLPLTAGSGEGLTGQLWFTGTTDANRKIFFTNAGTYAKGTMDAASYAFQVSGSAKMTINSAGNVGIGTTSPDALLEISGNAGADPGPITNPTTFRITDAGNAATGAGDTTNDWGKIEFYSEDQSGSGPSVQAQIGTIYDNIYSTASNLAFKTRISPTAALTERLRIKTSGALSFYAYSGSNNTGTPTYLLGTDASGDVFKTNTIPGSDAGPYVTIGTDQTITGAKTINTLKIGSANKIQFANNDFIRYEDATGVGRFHFDSDGGVNNSSVQAATFIGDLNGTINTATTGTTQTAGDNSTKIATTAYADAAAAAVPIGNYVTLTTAQTISGVKSFSGKIGADGGIDGLTLANGGISGSNFDITGVNQLVISDPGEGIVFTGTTTMILAAVDDATDSILKLTNATRLDLNSTARITSLVDPTDPQDAATKNYVDGEIGNIPSGLAFEGNWNAATDTPTLSGTTPDNGKFWIVTVAGSTDLSGITDWEVGDWAIYVDNGAGTDAWQKVDNSSTLSGLGAAGKVAFWSTTANVSYNNNFSYDGTNLTAPIMRVGDGTDGYFHSDAAGRTAFTGGDFYIQSGVTNAYNYATYNYHGSSSGDNQLFRGNPLSGDNWSITAAGAATFTTVTGTTATITGNTLLGNSNGDYVHINDRLFVGATDSGNAEFWFGEGTTGDVNYGAHWHWDSGYTHEWFTVNNSTETLMMDYATNDASKVNWYRDIDIQDNDILIDSSHGFINSGAWTRNATPSGYIDFGPANTSHAHIYTDRPNFYFNKSLTVNGSSIVNQNDIRSKIFYDVDNTAYYADFSNGQIVLGGTGRIQGVDTVSASTDAANKAYVDAHGGGLGPFLPLAGGVMTGNVKRSSAIVGFLEGSYNNVGDNSTNTNPIYTIGSNYNPASTTLSNMYGIGYTYGPGASFITLTGNTGWGMYVASDGDARVWLDGGSGNISGAGNMYASGGNSTEWNTAYDNSIVSAAVTGTTTKTLTLTQQDAGTVTASWTDEGTVTGTGAATRVAFWNGTGSLTSDANLYWDNTNDRLGIGTITPQSDLDVQGIIRSSTSSTEYGMIYFNTGFQFYSRNGATKGDFEFNVTSGASVTSAMRIWGTGNVGQMQLPQYGVGNITGTAAKMLAVNSAGMIIEEDIPTGGITGVTAGTNLNGGGTSGTVTLNLDNDIAINTVEYTYPTNDSEFYGEIVTFGNFGLGFAAGELVCLGHTSGTPTWRKAKNTVATQSTGMLGIALGSTPSAGILVRGFARSTAYNGFADGGKCYISATDGDMTTTAPTATNAYLRIVGYVTDSITGAAEIYFCPDNTYVQIA